MEWTNDMVIQLLQQYQARPELWDVNHEMYRVQSKKYESWRELAALFECDIADVRKKLNSVFASHRREKKRVRRGLKSSWVFYSHLNFLPSHVDDSANSETHQRTWTSHKVKQQPSSPDGQPQAGDDDDGADDDGGAEEEGGEEDDEMPEIEALDEDIDAIRNHIHIKCEPVPVALSSSRNPLRSRPVSRPTTRAMGRKRDRDRPLRTVSTSAASTHDLLTARLSEALRLLKRSETFRQKDECDSFGEYIANSLRKHDERTQSMIKQAINNILFEQEMKKYSSGQQYTVVIANADENPLILDGCDDNDK